MPRLSEIRYGVKLEGAQVKIDAVEGALLTVTALGFIESEEWPGTVVVFSKGESKGWFVTYSQVVLEVLVEHKDAVPFDCMFLQNTSAAGRKFWTVE